MSTRCTTHFHGYGHEEAEAIIYRHSDGYPDSMLPALTEFFEAVEAQTADTRYTDPSYLAAKFVVWLAEQFCQKLVPSGDSYIYMKSDQLDFTSVGVQREDPGDIEYRYHVWCDRKDDAGRPVVTYDDIYEGTSHSVTS